MFPNSKSLTVAENNLFIPRLAYLMTILEPYYFREPACRVLSACVQSSSGDTVQTQGVWKAYFLNLIANYISASALLSTTQISSQNNHRLKCNV